MYAFYTDCHFMKCSWLPVKIISQTSWGEYLVEFPDGKRKLTANLKEHP